MPRKESPGRGRGRGGSPSAGASRSASRQRRTTAAAGEKCGEAGAAVVCPPATDRKGGGVRTVVIDAVPRHLAFNVHVRRHYRRHGLSCGEAVYSMVGYLHNETANIYTHLLGALVCLYWLVTDPPSLAAPHYAVVSFADACSMWCFLGSVIYHTAMNSVTEAAYRRLLLFDMAGIWVVNTGAGFAATWLLLPCSPLALKCLLAFGPPAASAAWIVFLARSPASRAAAFGVQMLLRVALILGTAAFAVTHWTPAWVAAHLLSESLSLAGAVINVLRIPERWAPGGWDLFQSHTIMHVCVAASMLSQHYLSLRRAAYIDTHTDSLTCIHDHHATLAAFLFGSPPPAS